MMLLHLMFIDKWFLRSVLRIRFARLMEDHSQAETMNEIVLQLLQVL
jgi:hypothetical protein